MKYFSFIFVLILYSCGPEAEELNRNYIIANKSGSDIHLTFYDTFTSGQQEVEIANGSRFTGDLLTYRAGNSKLDDEDSFYPSSAFQDTDSVVVIFQNEKKSSFYFLFETPTKANFSAPMDRNLYRHGNYSKNGNIDFVFTITEQDYIDAESCDNTCE